MVAGGRRYAGDYPATDAEGFRKLGRGWTDVPLFGGMVTRFSKYRLRLGGFSLIRNLRGQHPGYDRRGGSTELHTTAYGSRVMSLFQFSKGKTSERHFLAQFSDGAIYAAASDPPAVASGAFGTLLFTGASDPKPAAWSVMDDLLIFSTGADLPQYWPGDEAPVEAFFIHKGDGGGIGQVPENGVDYTVEVTDGSDATVAVLDGLGTSASDHCLMIGVPVGKLTALHFDVAAANGNASVASIQKYNGAWASAGSVTDTTDSGGAALAQGGSMTLSTAVTDAIPVYQQGACRYWFRVFFSAALDAEVEISGVRYSADPSPLDIVWDGVPLSAAECQVYKSADDVYERYAYASVDLSSMATGDKLYMAFADRLSAIYIDPADTPSTSGAAISKVGRFDGDAWTEYDVVEDGTDGISRPGWITIGGLSTDQPCQFNASQWRAFRYYLRFDAALSDDVLVSVSGQPSYEVADFGTAALCCAVWKQRALYVFDRAPQFINVSARYRPMVLRGDESDILDPGDGRANAVRAIVCFHNEILVLQEERGTNGGCTTLYQGRDNATFGKRILSTKIGTWTAKSAALVDGVYVSTATDERVATMVYFLSWHGLVRCDGRGVMDVVSDNVKDRFDPLSANCVRRGYEDRCGVFYDRATHVIRVWLVCGATATEPNWFGIYDLVDGSWTEDDQAAAYTAMCEVEAASGAIAVLQAAGDSDGQVWQLNTGSDDGGAAIEWRMDMELSAAGRWLSLQGMRLRLPAETAVTAALSVARNGRSESADYAMTRDLTAKKSGEDAVVITEPVKASASHLTVSMTGSGSGIHDLAIRATVEEER